MTTSMARVELVAVDNAAAAVRAADRLAHGKRQDPQDDEATLAGAKEEEEDEEEYDEKDDGRGETNVTFDLLPTLIG